MILLYEKKMILKDLNFNIINIVTYIRMAPKK